MTDSSRTFRRTSRGVAALFDDRERKELFKKYLMLLGLVEVLIFLMCWVYQLGHKGYDRFGPIETPFPWKVYFLVSFLAPVAITFLLGIVVIGFNQYFGESSQSDAQNGYDEKSVEYNGEKSGRIYKLHMMINWLQRLPFLGLLLLLAIGVGLFYKLDGIMGAVGDVGEKSVRVVLISAAILVALASFFTLLLIVLNFKLRKKSMEYQYKTEVANRFGIIILDDNTVLNSEGKMLIHGKSWKDVVPMLPAATSESAPPRPQAAPASTLPQAVDLKSTGGL